MGTLPDFNLGTWQQRYAEGFIGVPVGALGSEAFPIPAVVVPYVFEEQYIRILITSDNTRPNWKQAARIYQTIPTFLGNFDVIDIKSVALGKPEIFNMTQFPDGYKLRLEFFPWFKDVNILIHAWRSGL